MSETPLAQWTAAVKRRDTESVRDLFAQHPDLVSNVNDSIFDFDSPAVFDSRTSPDLVQLLVAHGADINQRTAWWAGGFGILEDLEPAAAEPLIKLGATVDIWAAVGLQRLDRVTELLDGNPGRIQAKGGDGKHPLHYARSPEMVDLLVSRGADVNARDVDHLSTPAQYNVLDVSVVRRLLHHGAAPDIFMAASLGDVDLLTHCVEADGHCVEARLGSGSWSNSAGGPIYLWRLGHDATPLQVAYGRGNSTFVDALLSFSPSHIVLQSAIWRGDEVEARKISETGKSAAAVLKTLDPSIMTRAAWANNVDAVRLLLSFEFDPHVTGVHESTPLDRAAFHGYEQVVALLLERDPDPPIHKKNEFGGTPLTACIHGAVYGWETGHPRRYPETVKRLIDAGSDFSVEWIPTGSADVDQVLRAEADVRGI